MSQYLIVSELLKKEVGEGWQKHIIATTDREKGNLIKLAKAEGFAGTVSYSKALSLLTAAKTQQQFEAFEGCTKKAEKARFYIRESRAGR